MAPTRMVRAYEVWPTKNVFCCWGHMMTGPIEDIGPNSCAWTSLLAPMACFFYVWGDVLWNPMEVPPMYAYVCCGAFASAIFWFTVTSFTDPGIIPRGPKPDGNVAAQRTSKDPSTGATVYETWCRTCHVYRPPRASHCSDCDNCVRDFDHHCPFTRNCIGARNYGPFVMFLVSTCASIAVVLVSSFVLPASVPSASGLDPHSSGTRGLAGAASLVFCALMAALLFSFTAYHISLICAGMTTKEHLKGRARGANSSSQSSFARLCEPCVTEPSELQPRQMVAIDVAPQPPQRTAPVISDAEL